MDALVYYITGYGNVAEFTLRWLKPDGTFTEICSRAGARSSANPAYSGATGTYAMTVDGALTTVNFGGSATLTFNLITKQQVAPKIGVFTPSVIWLHRDDAAVVPNASTRTYVTPDHPGILGLPLSAKGSRLVLVRAVGLGLGAFNVTDGLADPQMTLYHGTTPVLEFPGEYYPKELGRSPGQDVAATIVGAFPLREPTDCGQLFWLQPGVYTAVAATTAHANNGTVLLEAYILPYSSE